MSAHLLPEPAIVLDGEGTILDANAEAAACFGLAVGDIVGGDLSRLVTQPGQVTEAIAAAGGDGIWRSELVARRADGVPFPLDVSGRVIDPGPPPRALALLRDRNADYGVRTLAQRHFDVAFDTAQIGMALYNTEGRFVRANCAMCRMLGREPGELLGMRDQDLTHHDDRDTDLAAAKRILAGEIETFQTEKRFVRPGGEVVWAIANLTFLRDEHDRPISWLGQFQDVTEHRRLAERDSLTHLSAEVLAWALVELIAGLRFSFAGDSRRVTASVGVAPFAPDATDSEPLLAAADAALYEVKRAGGNACASRVPE